MSDRTIVADITTTAQITAFFPCVRELCGKKRLPRFCPLMKPTRRVYSARSISRPTCAVPSVCACRFRRKWAWRRRIFWSARFLPVCPKGTAYAGVHAVGVQGRARRVRATSATEPAVDKITKAVQFLEREAHLYLAVPALCGVRRRSYRAD